ncbi:GH116 family glycosyl-hydrolase [Draconibacterium sediminis]|uniref:GH116 family glycosyl-hydrolase n=1 Tax=Draconibacterium sediminis TaxID=1544798 RepID=UPI000696EE14|nr:GH116 family glycosyl-hydrolase [Draconibacterium sediminis]
MPVGGICTGQVYLGGDGQLWYWDVFNIAAIDPGGPGDRYYLNPLTQEKKFEQGFGLTVKEGDRVHVRSLNRNGFSDISFEGQYPIGNVYFSDPTVPVSAHLQAFSPFIPGDAENSGLPLTVVQYTLTNNTAEEVEVEITGWLQNMAGFQTGKGKDDVHENKAITVDNNAQLICTISDKYQHEMADWGSMSLTLIDEGQAFARAEHPKGINVYNGVSNTSDEQIALGEKLVGAVSGKANLKKGESKTFTYLLSWYFPNIHLWDKAHRWKNIENLRHYYSSRFTDAAHVSNYVAQNRWLLETTKEWNHTWYDSSLPKWFLDRTFVNLSTLATTACVRFDDLTDNPENEGRFYTYEGVYQGEGTCTHVLHYEQALGRVFPALARQLREQIDLGLSYNDGLIRYRGEFSNMGRHDGRGFAIDGHAGTIMRIYREHLMAPDAKFLNNNWNKIKKAIQVMIDQDKSKTGKPDGILEGKQYNTLDRTWYGKISWISGLYAASLRAGAEMAKEMGDLKFERTCRDIAQLAYQNIAEQLFNGEYFIQLTDPEHPEAPNTNIGCHTDQLLGQYWAAQTGLDPIVPEEQIQIALQSIMKYNFVENYGAYLDTASIPIKRWYADDDEAGVIMCTFPRGGTDIAPGIIENEWEKLVIGYFSEIWTGQEHQLAATLISEGLIDEATNVIQAVNRRYSGERRNPYNEIEYGNHYTRAMSGYAPFVSASGYTYNGPGGIIGFAPKLSTKDFKSAFISSEGWGSFTQKFDRKKQACVLIQNYGILNVQELRLVSLLGNDINKVTVNLDGKELKSKYTVSGDKVRIMFEPIELSAKQELEITIN